MPELGVQSLAAPGNEGAVTRMNALSSLLPVGMELLQQFRLRNDPRLNALLNQYISRENYNRSTGGVYGNASDGWNGGMGRDGAGNALTPGASTARYMMSQVNSSGGMQEEGNAARQALAAQYGVRLGAGPGLGEIPALDPNAVLGVAPGQRPVVAAVPSVETPRAQLEGRLASFLSRLGVGKPKGGGKGGVIDVKATPVKGSYAVGTTSVPETGVYQLHAGEAVVPASMNPAANAPGIPMLQQLPQGQPVSMAPGLNPQAQQQIINRGRESIDAQLAGANRTLRTNAAASGQLNSGALDRRMFDARLGALGAQSNLVRDVGIEAANRNFADTLAMNQFGEDKAAAERASQLQAYGLQQEGDLARAQLSQSERLALTQLAQERALAQGQQALTARGLGIQQQQTSNDLMVQLRNLAQQGSTERARLAQERELTLGSQGIQRELGRGQLSQQAAELAQQGRMEDARRLLERELGLGQQGIQRELGLGGLDVERLRAANDFTLGQGQLGYQNRTFDANYGRDLLNDATAQQQWNLNRNDALMRDLFGLGQQQDTAQMESMQQLMQLLAGMV